MILESYSGDWIDGTTVTGPTKTLSSVVKVKTGTSLEVGISEGWSLNNSVVGPDKTVVEDNVRRYLQLDSDANVTDLLVDPQDPPYTETDKNFNFTI